MNKKKKKIIRYSIIALAVILVATYFIIDGSQEVVANQYYYENYDEMEFNPYIANEDRLDNSFLEYGKVLTKYKDKGYSYYTGETIDVSVKDIIAQSHTDTANAIALLKAEYDGLKDVENVENLTKEEISSYIGEEDANDFIRDLDKIKKAEVFSSSELNVLEECKVEELKEILSNTNSSSSLYVSADGTTVTFKVNVPETALYSLDIEYILLEGRETDALVGFTIDGKAPFLEASNIALKRMYTFYDYEYEDNKDVVGNQIRPKSKELYGWQECVASNPEGLYRNPYRFYMTEGEHSITMTFSRRAALIRNIDIIAPVVNPTYDEYKELNGFSEDKIYAGDAYALELEVPDYTTSISTRMETDNDYYTSSNASVKPYQATIFNVFGGDQWGSGGDTVAWSFTVPETGWYELGFRYKSQLTYVSSFREIRIDGEIPFQDMEEYCFVYADGWTATSLKDVNQNPYLFYFEAGETHTITMVNKVGPLRHSLQKIEETMDSVSTLVNKVVKITASTRTSSGGYAVDANRDYDLQLYIPNLQSDIKNYAAVMNKCYNDIIELNGGKVTSYASAVKVAKDLFDDFNEDLEKIALSLNDITNAQTGLSNTMVSIKDQPIAVDYMVFAPKGYTYPNTTCNTWENFYVGAVRFINSFDDDRYSNAGAREGLDTSGMPEIEIYVARGREHVDIMRNMVSEQFTPTYGIKVNINMVAGTSEGLIMPRYVAGTAPDVAISITPGNVFEFAIRGALVPLNQFDDPNAQYNGADVLTFEELWKGSNTDYDLQGDKLTSYLGQDSIPSKYVDYAVEDGRLQSYHDQAFVPYRYKGDYYGFPETQGWSALFYRTDIFEELGIEPPDTWEEIYEILPALTNSGYNFCYNYGVPGYTPFLYQYGGDFYDPECMISALDTPEAYDSFMEFADLYLQYNFVYAANFYMRFKSGEMPVGIADLAFYQQLNYSAPELAGKWAMLPVPGHEIIDKETGATYVDRSTSGLGTCCIIVRQEEESRQHYDESWAFLQWWLSDDVQAEYGREVEATFGVASRWNPANMIAMQSLPYTQEELDVINQQWVWLKESPNTMGGYYTSRYLLTALNQTVIQGLSGRIAIEDAVKEINKEMKRKQKEFGIPETGSIFNVESIKVN